MINIKVTKSGFNTNTIRVQLHDKNNALLSEQILKRLDYRTMFDFRFTDDFPDYASITIVMDDPLQNTYILQASDITVLPAFIK